jgi:hypothetical protein
VVILTHEVFLKPGVGKESLQTQKKLLCYEVTPMYKPAYHSRVMMDPESIDKLAASYAAYVPSYTVKKAFDCSFGTGNLSILQPLKR